MANAAPLGKGSAPAPRPPTRRGRAAQLECRESARSLQETLSQRLNFNIMFFPRGVLMLGQTAHEMRAWKRTRHAIRTAGIETEIVSPRRIKEIVPILNLHDPRNPVLAGLWQERAGHRVPRRGGLGPCPCGLRMGVHVLQNHEVIGIDRGAKGFNN